MLKVAGRTRQTLAPLSPRNTKGSGVLLPKPLSFWLRGLATTCRRTGRWASASRSRSKSVFQSRARVRQMSQNLCGRRQLDNSTPLKHAPLTFPAHCLGYPRSSMCSGGRGGPSSAQEGVARRDTRVGLRAAGIPGTVSGDDAAARNKLADLPWRAGPSRPVARASGRLWTARARAHGLDDAGGRRSGRQGGEDRPSARLELGGPDAPGVRHRRVGVCPLWRPPPADRHAARSRGHPEDPRAPRPRPVGAESRPRPTRVRRRRILIGSARGRGGRRRAGAARWHSC